MPESSLGRFQSVLTEGVVIALGSAYVYLVTFFYEIGYCAHFGVPSTFISPNLTTILVAAAGIGVLVFSSFQFLGFSVPLIRAATNPSKSQKPYRQFFAINALLLIFGILLWRAYGFSWMGFLLFSALAIFLNFILFGIGLIIYRKKKSLRKKFEAINKDESDALDIWGLLFERIGRGGVSLVLGVVLTTGLAYLIGNGEAVRQEKFLLLKEPKDYALLRTYGDLVIAVQVDRSKKLVEHDLLLLRASSIDKLEFRLEMIGPLERKPYVAFNTDENCLSCLPAEQKPNPSVEWDAPKTARPSP